MAVSSSSTLSTRFLIISDTHNFEFGDTPTDTSLLQPPLPKVDVLLHYGGLTHCGGELQYKKAPKMLGAIDAEMKLVIAGNHDLDPDKPHWNTHLDEGDSPEDHNFAMEAMKGDLAAEAGVTYLEEGTNTFTLNEQSQFHHLRIAIQISI